MRRGRLIGLAVALALFLALALQPGLFTPLLSLLVEPGTPLVYTRQSLIALAVWHIAVVASAEAVAVIVAVALGILVTREKGAEFMTLARMTSNLGQTFPPIAVLAMTVPLVGFGFQPTFIALAAYGLLPVFENTVAGLRGVPATTLEAARGMGMSKRAILMQVELPLAAPVILAGIRISTIINIGTATIGSTVGAKGLGEVIIAGLQAGNAAYVLQGAMLVALMAVCFDLAFRSLERRAFA
ncbi:ABC transporter permease [Lutibaculum baratangense]|uniref:L-proline glycine betaine ABC transport system permease protein ProW n=1 Tax=Lutibaculum baratangense AMV1 TaxID=631454 RepID=V4RQ96_9HYPH|nr:ABC transporter permease [Lutibaculum baratangense]ESR27404.1 L-proline glycine betaine ABC transport system permease protein ProW [Lutibaculum baratangense AMV1]